MFYFFLSVTNKFYASHFQEQLELQPVGLTWKHDLIEAFQGYRKVFIYLPMSKRWELSDQQRYCFRGLQSFPNSSVRQSGTSAKICMTIGGPTKLGGVSNLGVHRSNQCEGLRLIIVGACGPHRQDHCKLGTVQPFPKICNYILKNCILFRYRSDRIQIEIPKWSEITIHDYSRSDLSLVENVFIDIPTTRWVQTLTELQCRDGPSQ